MYTKHEIQLLIGTLIHTPALRDTLQNVRAHLQNHIKHTRHHIQSALAILTILYHSLLHATVMRPWPMFACNSCLLVIVGASDSADNVRLTNVCIIIIIQFVFAVIVCMCRHNFYTKLS